MRDNTRVVNESVENINDLFQFCFLLVGLRQKNFPNELETLFLHNFLRENYGGHSVDEVRLAFTMAIKGELGLSPDEAKCYENFSPAYIATIMGAYRKWAANEFRRLEKHIPPSEDELKALEGPRPETPWGYLIERDYQHFLSFGSEHYRLWPTAFYDQLVADDVIAEDLWRKAMPAVREYAVGDLNKKMAAYQMHDLGGKPVDELPEAQAMIASNIKTLQAAISEYRSGEKDGELQVHAKQYCVLRYFERCKKSGQKHIYQPIQIKGEI